MPRTIVAGLLCGALFLAGCTNTPERRPGPNNVNAVNKGQFFYNCQNGDRVEVIFTPTAGVAVLIRNGERLEMQRQPTARGFIYTSNGTRIEGNGTRMDIVAPGLPPLQCTMEQ